MKLEGSVYIQYRLDNGYEDSIEIDATNTIDTEERAVLEVLENIVKTN